MKDLYTESKNHPSRKTARLWLDHNEFVGPIPESWMNMTELELLSLHHNTISGNIPSFWGSSMSKLADLRIDNNRFRGSIPSELGSCLTLKGLYLDENFLRGTVPSCLGNLKSLGTKKAPLLVFGYLLCSSC